MPTSKINISTQQAAVYVICLLEILFLVILVYVYKSNVPEELRTIIKDVFIGWNAALALALNTGGNSKTADQPVPPSTVNPTIVLSPVPSEVVPTQEQTPQK